MMLYILTPIRRCVDMNTLGEVGESEYHSFPLVDKTQKIGETKYYSFTL